MRQEDAEELQKKILSAKFNFNDFLKQTQAIAKMGSMSRVVGMIPGMNKVHESEEFIYYSFKSDNIPLHYVYISNEKWQNLISVLILNRLLLHKFEKPRKDLHSWSL